MLRPCDRTLHEALDKVPKGASEVSHATVRALLTAVEGLEKQDADWSDERSWRYERPAGICA